MYALKMDEATVQDRETLMALAGRERTDSETLQHASDTLATEGSVAVFERVLSDAIFEFDTANDPGPDEPVAPDADDEVVTATITSLQEFAAQVNAHGLPRDPK